MDPVSPADDLIRRAQAGDHHAFTDLVGDCDERMRRLAYRLMGSREAMDDALQDAYFNAYRKLADYDRRAAFSTWLYTIVYRTCLNQLRTVSRRGSRRRDPKPRRDLFLDVHERPRTSGPIDEHHHALVGIQRRTTSSTDMSFFSSPTSWDSIISAFSSQSSWPASSAS